LSTANKALVNENKALLVGSDWVKYSLYLGEKLEHHHLLCAGLAIPITVRVHRSGTSSSGLGSVCEFWHEDPLITFEHDPLFLVFFNYCLKLKNLGRCLRTAHRWFHFAAEIPSG
jgi:hypothetical protein